MAWKSAGTGFCAYHYWHFTKPAHMVAFKEGVILGYTCPLTAYNRGELKDGEPELRLTAIPPGIDDYGSPITAQHQLGLWWGETPEALQEYAGRWGEEPTALAHLRTACLS